MQLLTFSFVLQLVLGISVQHYTLCSVISAPEEISVISTPEEQVARVVFKPFGDVAFSPRWTEFKKLCPNRS